MVFPILSDYRLRLSAEGQKAIVEYFQNRQKNLLPSSLSLKSDSTITLKPDPEWKKKMSNSKILLKEK